MASRSIAELVQAAIAQRRAAVVAGRDLELERFEVTAQECEMLTYTPLTIASSAHISPDRHRICGILVVVAGAIRTRRRIR